MITKYETEMNENKFANEKAINAINRLNEKTIKKIEKEMSNEAVIVLNKAKTPMGAETSSEGQQSDTSVGNVSSHENITFTNDDMKSTANKNSILQLDSVDTPTRVEDEFAIKKPNNESEGRILVT